MKKKNYRIEDKKKKEIEKLMLILFSLLLQSSINSDEDVKGVRGNR